MLKDHFKNNYHKLTNGEKKILERIDYNLNEIDNLSITNIATITFSSTTSINRIVQKLGYNYSDFKYLLYQLQQENTTPSFNHEFEINPYLLNNVITKIKTAQNIYILCVGQTTHIGRYFNDILFKIGYKVHIVTDSDLISNIMNRLNNNDYLIYISSSGSTNTLTKSADLSSNTNRLLITSTAECTLKKYCSEIIICNPHLISNHNYTFSLQGNLMIAIDQIIINLIK